jgi:hypothetical protein
MRADSMAEKRVGQTVVKRAEQRVGQTVVKRAAQMALRT